MGIASKVGDYAFKAFTATLGAATVYLTATFSVNVYTGLAWHNAQSIIRIRSLNSCLCSVVYVLEFWNGKGKFTILFQVPPQKLDKQEADEKAP
ncbi:hypothetical protein Lal_00023807 [Lupinus albus]|nr:hypothetical protein Lal_00023807 [Lupinus albus]